jgi:hypothetical protein
MTATSLCLATPVSGSKNNASISKVGRRMASAAMGGAGGGGECIGSSSGALSLG